MNDQKKIIKPRQSYTIDAIPEDDARQEELNRTLRKPGEPGYRPPKKKEAASNNRPEKGEVSST